MGHWNPTPQGVRRSAAAHIKCPSPLLRIEPPRQAIKQWIPADADEISFHRQDAHHSNESSRKPREVPLDDRRILILDADQSNPLRLSRNTASPAPQKAAAEKDLGTAGRKAMLASVENAS